jgi:hypothetical protein
LIQDLTKLTDDELQTKIGEIAKRISQAYRLGMGDAINQLQMFQRDYHAELTRRNDIKIAEMVEKSAEFKNIIDIN